MLGGYTATPEFVGINMLCLSMCFSSSCSKVLSGLRFQVTGWVVRECHVDAHGSLGDQSLSSVEGGEC